MLWPRILFALTFVLTAGAQTDARLRGNDAAKLYSEIADLMEANRIVIPELARAGAPLAENFRQGVKTLAVSQQRDHLAVLYQMLTNAKVYLQLLDAMPKPAEFSVDVRNQINSLRDQVETLDRHFRATLGYREQQVLNSDRDNVKRYAEANRTVAPAADGGDRVVFFGDSITDGWKLNQYFTGQPYLNRGIGGQITGQLLGRMKDDVLDLAPSVMVVLAGTNDLARGVSNETIESNLEMIGILAEAAGIRPVLSSILPVSDYHEEANPRNKRTPLRDPERINALNRWISQTCKDRGWIYLDYFSALVDEAGRLQKDLANDGLHPNAEGYKVMAPLARQAIETALVPPDRKSKRRSR